MTKTGGIIGAAIGLVVVAYFLGNIFDNGLLYPTPDNEGFMTDIGQGFSSLFDFSSNGIAQLWMMAGAGALVGFIIGNAVTGKDK